MYYDKYIKIVFQSTQLSTLETIIYGWKLKQEDEQNLASISKQTQLYMHDFLLPRTFQDSHIIRKQGQLLQTEMLKKKRRAAGSLALTWWYGIIIRI